MAESTKWSEVRCAQYEFSIVIEASRARVWRGLTDQLGTWWLPDFHMLGTDSLVTLERMWRPMASVAQWSVLKNRKETAAETAAPHVRYVIQLLLSLFEICRAKKSQSDFSMTSTLS